jgi:AIG2 family protein
MSEERFHYFAYGSNMLTARLRAPDRCPTAAPLGVADLNGYELRWHKKSNRDGSGKCDIVEAPEASVSGVLFSIAAKDKAALDEAEGLNKGYGEIAVTVLWRGESVKAAAYKATAVDPNAKPYTWYRAFVVAGAREHGLSADYVARLQGTPAVEDHNRTRHAENMRLIPEAHA